jgi:hypothetical protein
MPMEGEVARLLDLGRGLAEALIVVVRGRGLLWVPDAEPPTPWDPPGTGWPGGDLPPTLAAALGRHATGTGDDALVAALSTGQPQELLWTPSMRWLPDLPLTGALRLTELATAVLPHAYAGYRRGVFGPGRPKMASPAASVAAAVPSSAGIRRYMIMYGCHGAAGSVRVGSIPSR